MTEVSASRWAILVDADGKVEKQLGPRPIDSVVGILWATEPLQSMLLTIPRFWGSVASLRTDSACEQKVGWPEFS